MEYTIAHDIYVGVDSATTEALVEEVDLGVETTA